MADWKQRYKAVVDVSIISIAIPVWATGELEDDRFGMDEDDDQEVLSVVTQPCIWAGRVQMVSNGWQGRGGADFNPEVHWRRSLS